VTPNLFEPINNTGILYCTPFAGTPQVDSAAGRWIYRSVAGDSIVGPALAQYALDQGFETMYVTFKDDKGSQGFSVSVANYFESNGGEIVGETALAPQAQSYRSEIEQITAADPDIVQMTAGLEVGGLFAQNWAERNIDTPVLVGNDVVNADFISRVGAEAAQGFFGPTPGVGPAFDTYAEQYEAMHGEPPSAFTQNNYDTAIGFALALHRAGEISRGALADNFRAVCNPDGTEVSTFPEGKEELDAGNEINFQGAGSSMDFTENNNVIGSTNIQNVQDGEWTTITTVTAEDVEPPEGY
jgi:ABC-type branched-subunit amino acid transport system substrate-binding protein